MTLSGVSLDGYFFFFLLLQDCMRVRAHLPPLVCECMRVRCAITTSRRRALLPRTGDPYTLCGARASELQISDGLCVCVFCSLVVSAVCSILW